MYERRRVNVNLHLKQGDSTMKQPFEDDDRVIADMSGVEKPSVLDSWFGLRGIREHRKPGRQNASPGSDPYSSVPADHSADHPHSQGVPDLTGEERRAALMGVMKASLLIGFAYLGGFALLIILLLLLWRAI